MDALDLNSDLGESFGRWVLGDDEAMLGARDVGQRRVRVPRGRPDDAAADVRGWPPSAGVVVGAQVGYRDLAGFGRRFVDVAPNELADDVVYQIGALDGMCRVAGHGGALRQAARRAVQRDRAPRGAGRRGRRGRPRLLRRSCRCSACPGRRSCARRRRRGCGRCGSSSSTAATPRTGRWCRVAQPGAVLHDPDEVDGARAPARRRTGVVAAVDGSDVAVEAESACVHGDSPGAVEMARAVRDGLAAGRRHGAGVRVKVLPFGDAALLVEVDGLAGGARAGRGGARPRGSAGVLDVVPAARTVLVAVAPGTDLAAAAPDRPGAARRPGVGAPEGEHRRDPGDLRRAGPRRGRPAHRARRGRGRRRAHGHAVADRVRRVRPGLRLPDRRRRAAAGAAPRRAAHHGAGRRRRVGRGVQRRLPAAVAGGLAADRADRRRAVGRRPRPAGAAGTRRNGPLRRGAVAAA